MPGGREVEHVAVVRERVVVERQTDDLHRLVEHLAVEFVGGDLVGVVEAADLGAERLGLTGHGASADPEDAATAREVVQRREVLRQLQRVPLRHDVERHPDPDPLGPFRQDRPDQQSVRDHLVAFVLEVVLGEPERVETELVGQHAHVEDLLGRPPHLVLVVPTIGRSGCAGTRIRHLDTTEQEDPSTHGRHCRKSERRRAHANDRPSLGTRNRLRTLGSGRC